MSGLAGEGKVLTEGTGLVEGIIISEEEAAIEEETNGS